MKKVKKKMREKYQVYSLRGPLQKRFYFGLGKVWT
jgi:hypothetical protein